MRIRKGALAAGIAIGSIGVPLATAGPALAVTPTKPAVTGVITGPHTFILAQGQVVVVGEKLHPDLPGYGTVVPVTAVVTKKGVTTVTTGSTFLPLNRIGQAATFTVVPAGR
jgi:hypothetical protein